MRSRASTAKGFTLVELLITVAIVGLLLSLLLVGIQRVRESAARTQSQNNLKQITLALHNFAQTRQGRLPPIPVGKTVGKTVYPIRNMPSVFTKILPFVDQGNYIKKTGKRITFYPVPIYLSPADPSIPAALSEEPTLTSYAANTLAFPEGGSLKNTFMDGTAHTILFSERYAFNCGGRSNSYFVSFTPFGPYRRATFADLTDVSPIAKGNPPLTDSSDLKKRTFQVAPSLAACDTTLLQTPHSGGILAASADGSVRVISPSISSTTFWSAVTPAGGEVLGKDW